MLLGRYGFRFGLVNVSYNPGITRGHLEAQFWDRLMRSFQYGTRNKQETSKKQETPRNSQNQVFVPPDLIGDNLQSSKSGLFANMIYFEIFLNKISIAAKKSLADLRAFSASSLVEKKLMSY